MKKMILVLLLVCLFPLISAVFGYDNTRSSSFDFETRVTTWSANITNFTELFDTPGSYSGEGSNCVKVNAGATALEFGSCTVGSGDNSSWNETHADGKYALIAAMGNATFNESYTILKYWDIVAGSYNLTYLGSVNNASYLDTSNITYDGYAYNVSINHTLDTYTNWNSIWSVGGNATFNESYTLQKYWDIVAGSYNLTYLGSVNNASYLDTSNITYDALIGNFTYLRTDNATYDNHNQANTTENETYWRGIFAVIGAGGNASFNESLFWNNVFNLTLESFNNDSHYNSSYITNSSTGWDLNITNLTVETFYTPTGESWSVHNGDDDLHIDFPTVGGNNYVGLETTGGFFQLYANPNVANDFLLATITETQGADTEINFYEGGTTHNRFWSSGSVRIGGDNNSKCTELTSDVDCDTPGTGADLVVQDDVWMGGELWVIGSRISNGTDSFTLEDLNRTSSVNNDSHSNITYDALIGNFTYLRTDNATYDALVTDNESWSESYAGGIYALIGSGGNASWNESHAGGLYWSILLGSANLTYDALIGNFTYLRTDNATYDAHVQDNVTWNESGADAKYADISSEANNNFN